MDNLLNSLEEHAAPMHVRVTANLSHASSRGSDLSPPGTSIRGGAFLTPRKSTSPPGNIELDNENRQLVFHELSQPQRRKRSAEQVWKTVTAKGHPIKRDFIENILKEMKAGASSGRKREAPIVEARRISCDSDWETLVHGNLGDVAQESGSCLDPRMTTDQVSNGIQYMSPGPSDICKETPSFSPSSASLPPTAKPGSQWEPLPIVIEAERCTFDTRTNLQDVIYGLLIEIDSWCSSLPQDSENCTDCSEAPIRTHIRTYVPDYSITEEQVTKDTLLLASRLRSALSHLTASRIIDLADQLREIGARLRDIGMPKECVTGVGLTYLKVAEIISRMHGAQEWVLEDLWKCASDLMDDMGYADDMGKPRYKSSRKMAAKKAADATNHLGAISSTHSDFYRASCLHYTAICALEDDHSEAFDSLKQSIVLFGRVPPSNMPYEHVREAIRAIARYWGWLTVLDEDYHLDYEGAMTVCQQVRTHAPSVTGDPILAFLFTQIAKRMFRSWNLWQLGIDPPTNFDEILSFVTKAVETLRPIQTFRPSRGQPALAEGLVAWLIGARVGGAYSEVRATLEEAITILATPRFDEACARAAKDLAGLLDDYLSDQLLSRTWNDAISTTRCIIHLGCASGKDWHEPLISFLRHFQEQIHSIRDSNLVFDLIDVFHPLITVHHRPPIHTELTKVLVMSSYLKRGLGAFAAALKVSGEALAVARAGLDSTDTPSTKVYIEALACHAQSLLDCDAYDEAAEQFREATSACNKYQCPDLALSYPALSDAWTNLRFFGLFGMVHARLQSSRSRIDVIIEASRDSLPSHIPPCWLSIPKSFDTRDADARAWLLLIQTALRFSTSVPGLTLASARESLNLMTEYYEKRRTDMTPYAQASVLGHRYILLMIVGEKAEAASVLAKVVIHYHYVFSTEINMARLPLMVFLEILLVFSQKIPSLQFSTAKLKAWKKGVYGSDISFFEDFVAFLKDLSRHIHIEPQDHVSEVNRDEESKNQKESCGPAAIYSTAPMVPRSQILLHHADSVDGDDAKRVAGPSDTTPSRPAQSEVSFDLPGKTVHFSDMEMDPPVSAQTLIQSKVNLDSIPNLIGRIRITKGPLCAGGFCDIFSGELTSECGSEIVAMKMLRVFNTEAHVVKAKKKFRWEVSLWRTLRHNYVLPFYGTCELDEFRLFMVSPWAEGGNALEYLRRNPTANRGRLLWQTSSALEYLHSGRDAQQVVHGDLKADNVLISAAGDALLCDFGLSRYVEEIISKSGSSSAGRAGGHARFMAPELLMPPKDSPATKPTTETDVYAFASLMLQIYTEQLPFAELPEAPAIIKLAHGQLPPRPVEPIVLERGCDDRIWALMLDCWQFQPAKRPKMVEISKRMTAARL